MRMPMAPDCHRLCTGVAIGAACVDRQRVRLGVDDRLAAGREIQVVSLTGTEVGRVDQDRSLWRHRRGADERQRRKRSQKPDHDFGGGIDDKHRIDQRTAGRNRVGQLPDIAGQRLDAGTS